MGGGYLGVWRGEGKVSSDSSGTLVGVSSKESPETTYVATTTPTSRPGMGDAELML